MQLNEMSRKHLVMNGKALEVMEKSPTLTISINQAHKVLLIGGCGCIEPQYLAYAFTGE
jgi:hypothetical protein